LIGFSEQLIELRGKWEAYRVENRGNDLIIAGSDERGTMFGIYHFIEKYLEVDPLYFWKDREPLKRNTLVWDKVYINQDEPDFKYRGLFINDEDLLTEWMDGGGNRDIDYPYYSQVVHPEVMENLTEAMVRLRYNLIIPASFIDIKNPAEKKLVDIAAKRSVFLSMHHIEPLGVSGFTYFNYWEERGKEYKFSYFSHPEELKQVWKEYAEDWAQYDNVVWQIGLRGVADRPMWMADENIPQSDADRGKLISDAMADQMKIIESVDKREEIPVTTTLWMEGSDLNRDGHLTFPENTLVVFSDNSPGWEMQEDFFKTEREPGRRYGIYYHHQLWGTGPHLAQGVPPVKAHEIMKLAVDHQANDFAILNVSNIRTFVLGLQANAEMLQNFNGFDPEAFLEDWCRENFSGAPEVAEKAYRQFFASYQLHPESGAPILLDGQIKRKGLGLLQGLSDRLAAPQVETPYNEEKKADNWTAQHLRDNRCGDLNFEQLEKLVFSQKEGLEKALRLTDTALQSLEGWEKYFFEVNMASQQKVLYGLTIWLSSISDAVRAYQQMDKAEVQRALTDALNQFEVIKSGQTYNTRGDKWENWYRGEKKMDLQSMKIKTNAVLEKVVEGSGQGF
tara:strand:- start:17141 stop:18997 length:1857 start_codon:yes stop_codon:yes gene_type:complete